MSLVAGSLKNDLTRKKPTANCSSQQKEEKTKSKQNLKYKAKNIIFEFYPVCFFLPAVRNSLPLFLSANHCYLPSTIFK